MVGLVLQKSHINTKDECHYVALVAELEARGAKVRSVRFLTRTASGLQYDCTATDGVSDFWTFLSARRSRLRSARIA